jgi:hypothetical protein
MPPSITEQHQFLDFAKECNFAKVRELIEKDIAYINVQPSWRWTALHQACYQGEWSTVEFLLRKGANTTVTTKDGETPRAVAQGRGHTACVKLLDNHTSVWLFDAVTGFLRSPDWTVPVGNFMDDNCLVFGSDEEHELTHDIFNAYRDMVDSLIERFLSDLGTTKHEFVKLCAEFTTTDVGQGVLEQLLAVDDFVSFKQMMVQRNLEIEAEAASTVSPWWRPCNRMQRERHLERHRERQKAGLK